MIIFYKLCDITSSLSIPKGYVLQKPRFLHFLEKCSITSTWNMVYQSTTDAFILNDFWILVQDLPFIYFIMHRKTLLVSLLKYNKI